ncbi:MAG: tRNA lysidine(34) synthetase TilS [Candidatus Omnitrophica bacterium]|nr:tRNA lysidine(34) synthetase TilS [Candidatus Omnitrophota bacterium]
MKIPRVSALAFQLERDLLRISLLPRKSRIVVGVSGGPDSVALLSLLHEIQPRMRYQLRAVYVNHGWRPRAARREEIFVQKLCRQFQVPLSIVRLKRNKQPRQSWEGTARQARYGALGRSARRFQAGHIALAHTLEDQAETVLLALFRGSGTHGISGMPPSRALGKGPVRVVRPLLGFTHEALRRYLRRQKMDWMADASNQNERFRRNWIRRQMLPKVSGEFGPHIYARIASFSNLVREEEEWLGALVHSWCKRHVRRAKGRCSVRVSTLLPQPVAFRRRVIRWMIASADGALTGITFAHVEAVAALLPRPQGRACLPRGIRAEIARGRLRVRRPWCGFHSPQPRVRRPGYITLTPKGLTES